MPNRNPSAAWWLTIGWWWRPLCWVGRVTLWLVAWPLGLWRSVRHGRRKRDRQDRAWAEATFGQRTR